MKFASPPFLIAACITLIAAYLLVRWLGGLSGLLLACLWGAIGLGVLHAAGRLPWIDRQPALSNLLQAYAPRLIPAPAPTPIHAGAGRSASQAAARETRAPPPDISKLVGIDEAREQINQLVEDKDGFKNTIANATVVFLFGPSGTGKTSMALKMAASLRTVGIVSTDRIVTVSEAVLAGLGDSYGPSGDTLLTLGEQIQGALDGVLLIDDIDRLQVMGGQVVRELGTNILRVATAYPRRLLVICTGSNRGYALVRDQSWIKQLKLVEVPFMELPDEALERIFLNLLASRGFQLAPDARAALGHRLRDIRTQGGDQFDNAYAVMRLADAALDNRSSRLRRTSPAAATPPMVVSADDVRRAISPT